MMEEEWAISAVLLITGLILELKLKTIVKHETEEKDNHRHLFGKK